MRLQKINQLRFALKIQIKKKIKIKKKNPDLGSQKPSSQLFQLS